MSRARTLLCTAGLALAALMLVAAPAGAAAADKLQPRFEAPRKPLPASRATTSAITGFQGSWLDTALNLQYQLGNDVGLRDAPWIGTHNSYNSVAEMGQTIATSDPNQQLSINDQLDLDIRSIEIDVHWFQRPGDSEPQPVVCHAAGNHLGCSTEKPLGPVLDEVNAWLRDPAHANQVLFVYLEDHLDNPTGYDTAAGLIQDRLGDILYTPAAGAGCQQLPLDLTRDQILAAGKRVVLVGNTKCGQGSAWPSLVFDWEAHVESQAQNFSDFPTCGTDFTREQYQSTQVRYYEDGRPSLSGFPGHITPELAAGMARCGVDLIGLDQLAPPDDARLTSLVWSWAQGQPKKGTCAVQRAKPGSLLTLWKTRPCSKELRPACRKGATWLLGRKEVGEKKGRKACKARHAQFAVPRTGYEAQLLRLKMRSAHVSQAWLGYVKRNGEWTALDNRAF
jgi:hypothetical protein